MKVRILLLLVCIFYVHLINGEVIKAKSVTRGKFDPEYRVTTTDERILRIPFTSVLKIEEKNE